MINDEIFAIKNSILKTVGDACEKIYLFGSYAYGTPRENSDYDFFVVLKDGTEKPLEVMENIHCNFGRQGIFKSIDVLASYKSRFEVRSAKPTIERKILNEGVVLYERL
jgi:predicted nucleotidyltransferase